MLGVFTLGVTVVIGGIIILALYFQRPGLRRKGEAELAGALRYACRVCSLQWYESEWYAIKQLSEKKASDSA